MLRTIVIPSLLFCLLYASCGERTGTGALTAPTPDSTAATPLTGHQVVHTSDGGRMEGMRLEGQRDGLWTSYFPNGTIRSRRTYVNGVEQGPAEVFHPNGMTFYRGTFVDGNRVGLWEFFDEQGTLVKTVEYDSQGEMVR
jgi:hypothetical protein